MTTIDLNCLLTPQQVARKLGIQSKLVSWSPSLFIGCNSIWFDEHFLRQCLYQTLHAPYLTNTSGNSRSDAPRMVHAVSAFSPDVINIPVAPDGSQAFKLDRLAAANGFNLEGAHDAAVDVAATIHMCRLIAERAPDVWSNFMRFSQTAAAASFIEEEDIFCLFDRVYGRSRASSILALAFLAPDIVEAILEGRQPPDVNPSA